MFQFLLLVGLAALARAVPSGLHPRPEWKEVASYARWLVHESDYAVISTHSAEPSGVFGNIISISDGAGYEDSTGIIYTYIPDLDATYKDLMADDRVALTFTEMALAGGQSGGCSNHTAENPPCGRFTMSGRLTRVPADKEQMALKYLYSRHPEMKDWGQQHHFKPFWIAKENITGFFVIDMFGGATPVNTSEYLAAPWYRHNIAPNSYVCSVCGHTYDPEKDGGGKSFEDLPATWTCPVCGQPKSAYKKQASAVAADTYVCSVCGHQYDPEKDGGGTSFEDLPATWTCPVCGQPKSSYKKQTSSVAAATYQCSVCQHVYDPEKDGGGKSFEDLPATWTCPVCGQPKSSYKKSTKPDGSVAWVHV